MRQQLMDRLATLRSEYEAGQKMLAELESRQLEVRQTVLRISGAIQVLEELLAAESPDGNGIGSTAAPTPLSDSPADPVSTPNRTNR